MKRKAAAAPDRTTWRFILSGLLVFTALLHLFVGAVERSALQAPLLLFGGLFLAVGIYVRVGGRTAVLTATLISALGLALGGGEYLRDGGPNLMPLMFLIDIVAIGAAIAWLRADGSRSKKR